MVECATVSRTRVDEQRIHGAVEQHDVATGVQGVEGIQLTDHQKRSFNPSRFWGGHRPAQGRDVQRHDVAVGSFGGGLRHVATGPRRHRDGHDVRRIGTVLVHHGLSPRDGAIRTGRTAQSMANVLAEDAQVFMRLAMGQDFAEHLANEGTVGAEVFGLSCRHIEQGEPQAHPRHFSLHHGAR